MYAAGHVFNVLTQTEVEKIHRGVLRILGVMGMQVQNGALLRKLAEAGLPIDAGKERVYFPEQSVETFLAAARRPAAEEQQPTVSASAGLYHGKYHDPDSNALVPWEEDSLAFYFALARALEHVDHAQMLGCRLPCPPALESLYERFYCWKYGAQEGSSIYLDELCPYLLEMYERKADADGRPIGQLFRGTVYLVPVLKLGRHEAYQVAWFWKRGLRVRIGGSMLTLGATAPVTLASAVMLNTAEQLALRMFDWALWGDASLHFAGSISPLDMRTTIRPYGRPESPIANLMLTQMARFYGGSFSGHAGLSDAMLPSVESGAQKALSATATLLAGGRFHMDAGLLGIDEICSPVQLVLDNEFLSALKHFTHCFEISDETLALELILETGPGGHYLDQMHTAEHFRSELWNPAIWSRAMLKTWESSDRKIDADLAREVIAKVRRQDYREPRISSGLEKELAAVLARAGKALA